MKETIGLLEVEKHPTHESQVHRVNHL
jgi:hypothetical protein